MEHISALNAARGLAIKAGEGFLTSPVGNSAVYRAIAVTERFCHR